MSPTKLKGVATENATLKVTVTTFEPSPHQNCSCSYSTFQIHSTPLNMQNPPTETECIHIDISVAPSTPPPQPPIGPTIPAKLLRVMKKYRYNWRLDQLSKPKTLTHKFEPQRVGFLPPTPPPPKLRAEMKFYADQMSKPKLRNLYVNKRLYSKLVRGLGKKFTKNINKTWGTIYNYYKKKERDRRLRQLNRQKQSDKGQKPQIDQKIFDNLAKPKPSFTPEPIKKPSKIFSDFDRLDEMATPKASHVEPPKSLGVSPQALTYEPTEIVLKLAQLPARMLNLQPPLEPGKVKRGALRYKITPRTEVLAQPKQKREKSKEEEEVDPWAISKNALKYKPTPRILELAKPVERD